MPASALSGYVRIDVVRPLTPQEVGVYRCLQSIVSGKYMVQSFDRVRLPVTHEQLLAFEAQFFELLSEVPPEERGEMSATLAAAVAAFDEDFAL